MSKGKMRGKMTYLKERCTTYTSGRCYRKAKDVEKRDAQEMDIWKGEMRGKRICTKGRCTTYRSGKYYRKKTCRKGNCAEKYM